jgi:hypothetical protein
MSTAAGVETRISSVEVTDEAIAARLIDGRVSGVPLAWSWRLSEASDAGYQAAAADEPRQAQARSKRRSRAARG